MGGVMSRREFAGRRAHAWRPGLTGAPDHGYTLLGNVIIGAAILLLVGGLVLLVSLIVSSSTSSDGGVPPTGPSAAPTSCPAGQWLDAAAGACVAKATCPAGQLYRASTNTCVAPGPSVLGVDPDAGPATGGTAVTITGRGFADGATVTIDGAPATDVTVVDAETITAVTPAGENLYPVDVAVTNPGKAALTLNSGFTYETPPEQRLTAVQPDRGSNLGGERVLVRGRGFVPGARVTFFARPALDVVVVSSTRILATTPSGPLGPVQVNVKNPDEAPYTLADGFTFVDVPPRAVDAVRPPSGSADGGTRVTIVGAGFEDGARVTFGGVPATEVTVVSGTRIIALTPPGPLGPVEVSVKNPDMPAVAWAREFRYVTPTAIASVRPARGPTDGGTRITIIGEGFADGATVTIDGAPATDVTVVSAGTITATTPQGGAGPALVVVENPREQPAELPRGFTYERPAP